MAVLDVTHKDSDSTDNNIAYSEIEEKEDRTTDSQQVWTLLLCTLVWYVRSSVNLSFWLFDI